MTRICFSMMAMLVLFVAGCSQEGGVNGQVTAATFNVDNAPTVEFSLPDMMCEDSCAVKAKEILSGIPGAREVFVDFGNKTATVAIEEGEFDSNAAIAALVDHSFVHTTLNSGATGIKNMPGANSTATQPAPVH